MAKSRLQKESDYAEVSAAVREAKAVVFTEYRGTTVKDIDAFRRALGKEAVKSKVYKVTLINKALADNGIDVKLDFKTPVIMSYSLEDEVAPARLVKAQTGDIKTMKILSGVFSHKFASKTDVLALADLPSKDQLRAQLVGTINAPVSGFVNVLAGNIRGLLNVLNAVASKS